jgi:hypothetical protein
MKKNFFIIAAVVCGMSCTTTAYAQFKIGGKKINVTKVVQAGTDAVFVSYRRISIGISHKKGREQIFLILFIPLPHCSISPNSLNIFATTLFLASLLPFAISSAVMVFGKLPGETMFTMSS